jgi:hypothetical protein
VLLSLVESDTLKSGRWPVAVIAILIRTIVRASDLKSLWWVRVFHFRRAVGAN